MNQKLLAALLGAATMSLALAGCGLQATVDPTTTSRVQSPVRLNLDDFRADGVAKKQVLVSFKRDLTAAETASFESRNHVHLKRSLRALHGAVIAISGAPEAAVTQLEHDPAVAMAEVDRAVLLDDVTVNDPRRGRQYALDTVNANAAWGVTMGSDKVTIAIVDSGVDLDHPDLKAKLLAGYNTLDPSQPPKDDVGHGTHVAGIASALTNNQEGVAGLAANCKILPVKVLSASAGSAATVAEGITWAADHGADVINMSLGFYDENASVNRAVAYALSKNVVIVATMGNDNSERKRYPGACAGVISVGSTAASDKRSDFSNYGAWMSICAPGSDILSTFPTYPVSISGTPKYAVLSGTSMAAPLVTGLVGLIRSRHAGMAPADVKKVLEASAKDLGDPGFDKYFGNGRIDAFKAVAK